MRTGVSPGHRRASGAKGCLLAASLQTVQASQVGTAPVRDSSTSLPTVAEAWPADAGDQVRLDGSGLVQGGTGSSADTRERGDGPNANPKPLQRAIPTLTGAVLVVNAPMGEQQRPAPLTGGLLSRLQPGRAA